MKKSVIIIAVICFRITCLSFSQVQVDIPEKGSGFHIGISHIELREGSLNRAIHRGPGLTGAVYLERTKPQSLKRFNMELGSVFLRSDFEGETSSYLISGSASFSYLRNLRFMNPVFSMHLGGRVKAGSAIEYFENWDESHFYWITSYSIGADLKFSYSFGRNSRITFEADFPVLSLVSRPPDKFLYTQSSPALSDVLKDIHQDLEFQSIGGFRDFTFQLQYSLRKPKKFVPNIFLRYSDRCLNKDEQGQVKYIRQTIGLEFRF
ncbi:MAG: hypothetical protein ACWGNV_00010 [Bacteroidales bacterium]